MLTHILLAHAIGPAAMMAVIIPKAMAVLVVVNESGGGGHAAGRCQPEQAPEHQARPECANCWPRTIVDSMALNKFTVRPL